MAIWSRTLALAALIAALTPAVAETVATPATIAARLDAAHGGDVIRLAAGDYPAIELSAKHWSPAVVVEAADARLAGVQLRDVSGLTWHGGSFDGGDTVRSGFNVDRGDHIVVDGAAMSHYARNGIGFGSVSDARIVNNRFTDMGSDGIDIALSRRIVVDRNHCSATHPTPGAHPDCVQLWSRPTAPPTADIVVSNNEATGDTQGFTAFNHARPDASGKMVDDGGFDRITVENNTAKVMTYHGVTIVSCRSCIVRNNRAETITDPARPRVRAWIKMIGDSDATFCGNVAKDFPGAPGSGRCRD